MEIRGALQALGRGGSPRRRLLPPPADEGKHVQFSLLGTARAEVGVRPPRFEG